MNRDLMQAHAGMMIRAVILSLSFSVVGLMGEHLPPLLLTALRFVMAAFALSPLLRWAPDRCPGLRGFALYCALGLCQASFFGAMFWTANQISPLSMTVLYVTVPFLAYCLGLAFQIEEPSGALLGILALGACGALGLTWAEGGKGLGTLRLGVAEGVFFIGCLGLALYSVLSRWGLDRRILSQSAGIRTFWSLAIGALLVGGLGLSQENPRRLTEMTPVDLLLLAYLGLLSTGGTFWLMQRAASVLTPAVSNAYSFAPAFVSMLLLFVAEPQTISWRWLPGALLVVLAMTLLLRRDAVRTEPNVEPEPRPSLKSTGAP